MSGVKAARAPAKSPGVEARSPAAQRAYGRAHELGIVVHKDEPAVQAAASPKAADSVLRWHALATADDAIRILDSHAGGLTEVEAARRLVVYGRNELTPVEKPSLLKRIWEQLNNVLIFILLVAAVVSGVLLEWAEVGLILAVIAINVAIGIIQEGKAEKAAEALKAMLSQNAMVLRDGERKSIGAALLVPGDIVLLQSGDRVPADVRIVAATNLQVQEAMLTGESLPVTKRVGAVAPDAALGDRKNMAFSATLVMSGTATAVVVETGDFAEVGRISALVASVDNKAMKTNLLVQLEVFGRWISIVVLIIAVVQLLVAHLARGVDIGGSFQNSVAVAVAIIPEGLPAVVTITLALGVSAMARKKAIIRQLPAVETLGSVTVICSDKTGTLTKNMMTATNIMCAGGARYVVSGTGYDPIGEIQAEKADQADANAKDSAAALQRLLRAATLCNDSALRKGVDPNTRKEGWLVTGDPTELALLSAAIKGGVDTAALHAASPRTAVIPFESEHKFMGTVHKDDAGDASVLFVKGAPDRLIPRCTGLDAAMWQEAASAYSSKGLRVLAVCSATLPADFDLAALSTATVLSGAPRLSLLGLVAIMDPPREEAVTAIKEAHCAGIVVKMITGDHPQTALAIGRMLAIVDNYAQPRLVSPEVAAGMSQVYTGPQLDAMTDDELKAAVLACNVFARASPENKIRIVRALQSAGQVTSMTGDGVNDAPALKAANVGVAMGITGTDVSKEAAKMVLGDDNFSSIVAAVEEGRRVWDNLRKILLFNTPVNFAQGLAAFFAYIVGMEQTPMTAIQILYVNMITSITMGIAVAFEPAEPDVMRRPPRRPTKRLLGKQILWRTVFVAALMVAAILGAFQLNLNLGTSLPVARAEAFTTLVLCEVMYAFNARFLRSSSLSRRSFRGNPTFFYSIVITVGLQVLLVHAPGVNEFFSCAPMGGDEWGRAIGFAFGVFFIIEIEKWAAPRFIMPWFIPLLRAVSHAMPAMLRVQPQDPSKVRFIATSASTFGVPNPARTHSSHRVPGHRDRAVSEMVHTATTAATAAPHATAVQAVSVIVEEEPEVVTPDDGGAGAGVRRLDFGGSNASGLSAVSVDGEVPAAPVAAPTS